jgi:predicted dienelactone hydrolase
LGWLFDEQSLESISIPVHIVAVGKDLIVPMEKNAEVFAKRITQSKLSVIHDDAGHYVFLNRPSLLGKRLMAPQFCEDHHTVDRRQVHEQVGEIAVNFFDEKLSKR